MEQPKEPTFNYSVKISDDLRQPVRKLAFETDQEIRVIVSDAVRERLKKIEKAGEK